MLKHIHKELFLEMWLEGLIQYYEALYWKGINIYVQYVQYPGYILGV